MDIDFRIEDDTVVLVEKENQKDKRRKQRKVLVAAEDNLRTLVIEKISGRMGEC